MSDYQHISHGFEPVFDERSRILVLGSFPSVQSRKNAFYYGNPQNRFWRVMAACLGEPVPPNEGEPISAAPTSAAASAYRDTQAASTAAPACGDTPAAQSPLIVNANDRQQRASKQSGEAGASGTQQRAASLGGKENRTNSPAQQGENPAGRASLADSIAAKKRLLLAHGIALWDVIESCDIKGSSDASIKNVVPAQVERVLEAAHIGAVVCNGGTAGRLYKRYLQWQVGLAAHVLPSTSPANAQWGLDRLTERWRAELAPLLAAAADGTLGEALPPSSIKRSFVTVKVQVAEKDPADEGPARRAADDNEQPATHASATKRASKRGRASAKAEAGSASEVASGSALRAGSEAPDASVPVASNKRTDACNGDGPAQKSAGSANKVAGASALRAGYPSSPRVQYATVRVESPAASSWSVHKSMQGNKRANTKPELVVRERLRAAGLGGYRLQWKVPGHPDIAWPGKRVAIEVRGCFWHRCPHCNPSTPKKNTDYWQAKFARNIERDKDNLRQLTDMGWRVHVIWECQLKKRTIDATMAKLLPELAAELEKELRPQPVTADAENNQTSRTDSHEAALPSARSDSAEGSDANKLTAKQVRSESCESKPNHSAERKSPERTDAEQPAQPHFMYVLECADGSLYTGYTPDVEARLAAHRAGTGAKYTRGRGPLNLLAVAQFATKHDAMSAEYRFKRLARDQKDTLLAKAAKPNANFADILRETFGL